ncbi:50S ribosomal protein L10 [Patescibacteria group bacterium]|nr:50S ribosomal protein L10 [Patescibacteria group bacterium]
MPITKQKKEEILQELNEKFKNAKSVAFGQYAGMTVEELSNMRREMRESNVEFKVAKKTLLKLAAKENGLELPNEVVEGTVGAVFSYDDPSVGPKIVKDTSKKVKVLQLMGGIMDGAVLSVADMNELASLPSRDMLLAKFMMMMRAPLTQFHGAISSPLSSFARAMKAYAEQMPAGEAPATPEPAAAPAEEAPAEVAREEAETPEVTPEESPETDTSAEAEEAAGDESTES